MRSAGLLLLVSSVAGPACAPRLDLGSDLLWMARHEGGDLGEWTAGDKGGSWADTPDTSIAVSTEYAHSGRYSVKLSNAAVSSYEEVRLWRTDQFPQAAYYSAWYYLPRAYQTTDDWTIMQLRAPLPDDRTTISQLLDVDLRSLPMGDLILSVYDHRPQYLRAATPDPAVVVPIGSWFQVQAYLDYSSGADGRFALWLNGQPIYDLPRPFNLAGTVYFSACSVSQALSPTDSAIYLDDAAVSLTPVDPQTTL
ncbi:MAG TPA: heparin lyase I family protein [Polyangia bacterium]|nr:heparin lyase I family protein [Polyangia bacterium]